MPRPDFGRFAIIISPPAISLYKRRRNSSWGENMRTMYLAASALALALAVAACAKKEEPRNSEAPGEAAPAAEDAAADIDDMTKAAEAAEAALAVDPDAPPADGTERFYGKKAFTIVSKQSGMETGDIVEHVRDWGRRSAQIKTTSIAMGGFTQTTNQRVIQDGADIITVDDAAGTVTATKNPMYDSVVAAMKGKSGVAFGKEIMTRMGGRETGEKGYFAGYDCTYWELASVGTRTCVTDWGGTLHTLMNMAGMTVEKTAVEVRLGDGGPDDAFAYDASKAVAAPDISEIMKQMRPDRQ
jgi:hypothetical protein